MQLFIRKNNNKENIQNIQNVLQTNGQNRKKGTSNSLYFFIVATDTIDPVAHQGPGNLLGEEALLSRKNWLAIGDDFVFVDLFPQA